MFLGLFHLMTRLIGFLTAVWKKSENENKQMLRFFEAEMLRFESKRFKKKFEEQT